MQRRSFLSIVGASLAIPAALVKETNANVQDAELSLPKKREVKLKRDWVPIKQFRRPWTKEEIEEYSVEGNSDTFDEDRYLDFLDLIAHHARLKRGVWTSDRWRMDCFNHHARILFVDTKCRCGKFVTANAITDVMEAFESEADFVKQIHGRILDAQGELEAFVVTCDHTKP